MSDYPKKYWWVVLVIVPIIAALIGITPPLLEKVGKTGRASTDLPSKDSVEDVDPVTDSRQSSVSSTPPRDQVSANKGKQATKISGEALPENHPGMVQASGVGFAPSGVQDAARRVALARRAAEVIAMRNLTESIRGAVIESYTKTRNDELSEDVIRVKVNAVLMLAHKIKDVENANGSVSVILEAPIRQ